ncbi:LytR C-terminal domain-containing protein [Sanguibacter hominis ATCC BAA-789]|uniref:LytR C-terminal domain-containing protein n=1 Tax=Sanguibacter hominis ATCC BAA-789 TaxID=1312740 RepID=A0A9X5FH89_9MICO|nr:LytR C-terminal domain-containing protein [Sanguibacter hominis ATCC BAA-789]
MTDYPYPADEFDEAPAGGQSAGIHRAPVSRWSRVWPFLAVVLIFAALATGLYVWFTSQSPSTPAPAPTVTAQETTPEEPTTTEEPATTEEPTTPDETTTDDATTDDATTDDAAGDDEPAQEPDRTITVRVLNATRTQGLAAGAVADVKALGYTDVSGDNYRGAAVSSSQVWYKGAENAAAAKEIADKLGIASVDEVSSLVGHLSVILASDFAS